MYHPNWNPLNKSKLDHTHDTFFVRVSKPGPRGGKRPPLWEGYVRARSYDDAVGDAEGDFLSTTKTEVVCLP